MMVFNERLHLFSSSDVVRKFQRCSLTLMFVSTSSQLAELLFNEEVREV